MCIRNHPTKWVQYIDNRFVGKPQTKKGSGTNWIPVITLGGPTNNRPEERLVKDEKTNFCYAVYVPKGMADSEFSVTVTTT